MSAKLSNVSAPEPERVQEGTVAETVKQYGQKLRDELKRLTEENENLKVRPCRLIV